MLLIATRGGDGSKFTKKMRYVICERPLDGEDNEDETSERECLFAFQPRQEILKEISVQVILLLVKETGPKKI